MDKKWEVGRMGGDLEDGKDITTEAIKERGSIWSRGGLIPTGST